MTERKKQLKHMFYSPRTSHINGVDVIHRSVPIMTILFIVFIMMIILFVAGMMIGYGILHSPMDIFKPSTWTHIMKLTGSDK